MTSNSPPGCPFLAGPKIEDPQYFVGRTEALDFITSRAASPQPTSINVVGKGRIGKSSLLYHFCRTYEERVQRYGRDPREFVAIYLSLQDNQCRQEASFYQAVARELLQRPSVQGNSDLRIPLNGGALSRQTFADAMDEWKDRGVLPILCLDKIEELFDRPNEFNNDFYDSLRSLMDRNALMLVITSAQRLDVYSRKHRLTSDFFNLGHCLSLKELTEMEARDLVRLPQTTVPGTSAALSPEKQQLALEWGGRHPYFLQLAGSFLWEARRQDREVKWAKQQFDREVQRAPISRFNPPRWWRPLRWLFWDLPVKIGSLAKLIGGTWDDIGNWIFGVVILISLAALLLGKVPWERVKDLLEKALGG